MGEPASGSNPNLQIAESKFVVSRVKRSNEIANLRTLFRS
jgi:hypothetical protein